MQCLWFSCIVNKKQTTLRWNDTRHLYPHVTNTHSSHTIKPSRSAHLLLLAVSNHSTILLLLCSHNSSLQWSRISNHTLITSTKDSGQRFRLEDSGAIYRRKDFVGTKALRELILNGLCGIKIAIRCAFFWGNVKEQRLLFHSSGVLIAESTLTEMFLLNCLTHKAYPS